MLAASQDIDRFIERQRSKLNKQSSQQPANRQPPVQQPRYQQPPVQQPRNQQPPPPPLSFPPENLQERLDFKVARILDEPPPRIQSQQPFNPPSPPPFANNPIADQQMNYYPEQQRRSSYDNNDNNNPATFFNRFGTYDDKRSQLKDDLKREYNEYLQAQKGFPKSKSSSQLLSPRGNNNRQVQFQQSNGKVVAPWEKNNSKNATNVQNMNNSSTTVVSNEYTNNRSRMPTSSNHNEQYIRDREEYILELHSQVRELETRRKQLELDGSRLSAGGSSMVTRAHYTEDLNALNSLLAERIDQRSSVDHELARILNRPPVSSSPTRVVGGGMPALNMSNEHQVSSQMYQQPNGRHVQPYQNENRSGPNSNGFTIGHEVDKDVEQASKKRYQQELQSQMREAQMRKAQAKHDKDEYDRKIDADIQRYNYFGRSGGGGGAPMRDKDGNVVANLADVRNPAAPPPPQTNRQQQSYFPPDDKVYSLGNGLSSITNAPFYGGEQQQQYSSNSDRPNSPNHARGAVSNGIFGTAKTDAQIVREEKYKQDLKKQMDDKRQREAEETAKRRAEEERELAKHLEWQQQMEKQTADEASRKQDKEDQERLNHQHLQDEIEKRKKQDELMAKQKSKRPEKPMSPKRNNNDTDANKHHTYDEQQPKRNNNDTDANKHHTYDEQQPKRSEAAYRTSSPPVPTLKNKDRKHKSNARRQSADDLINEPSFPPLDTNDDYHHPAPVDDANNHDRQTYRKPPTPRQPDIQTARKKPPQTYRSRPRQNSASGMPIRTNSAASLRSDGSDSEVLNRLEHLKQQLKDREARLQAHVNSHQESTDHLKTTHTQRKQSPGFLLNAARVHRDSPTTNDIVRRILQNDDDLEYKPSYFRDDTILLGGAGGHNPPADNEFFSSMKRINSGSRKLTTDIEKQASRRRHDQEPTTYYDQDDPTSMANFELNRIAKQNEQRLKKLRDLENDDASLLDSNEVLERFQQKQRLQRGGSGATVQDDAWFK